MATKIDQKAYLQRYLSGPSSDKKKKKKKKVVKGKGFQIIDDDLDISKLRTLDGDELDILDQGEDAPQIAGIIDERPEEIKKLEQFKTSSKWRVINQDDGFNSRLQIEEVKKDVKAQEKENEFIFGKMYSDSEDEQRKDSDGSPPKESNNTDQRRDIKKSLNNSDSDFSPPRKRQNLSKADNNKKYDSDISPPRKHEAQTKQKVRKPSRWGYFEEAKSEQTSRHRSPDSDISPPRKRKEPSRHRKSPSSDVSPPRKSRQAGNQSDSDASPPRKSKKDSPNRKKRQNDMSYKSRLSTEQQNRNERQTKTSQKHRQNSTDSDLSPPRKNKEFYSKQRSSDSDMSPRRRSKNNQTSPNKKKESDGKKSPSRIEKDRNGRSRDDRRNEHKRSSNSPPPSNKKMAKTLEGKIAGLQDAKQLRRENEAFRMREEEVFNKLADNISGRTAKAVSRKAGKRETSEERRKQQEKAERQKELDEKYKKWGRGLKQVQAQEDRIQEFIHEAAKPLARHKDDKDLENSLKGVEREGDPMLNYMRERKRERGELGPEKPMYKGNFPPNRFNIRPGYRWDGVDRSNGYEKKFFETRSKKKAQEEEYYKWSSADL